MSILDTEPKGFSTVVGAEVSGRAHALREGFQQLFALHGCSADGPHPGESDLQYMRRGLNSARRYSPTWNKVDFTDASPELLRTAYQQVVADGIADFKKPIGELRELRERDRTGREVVRFFGHPESVWGRFKQQPRVVERFLNLGRGADSVEVRARRAAAEARHHAAEAALRREEQAAQAAAAPERPAGFLQRFRAAVSNTDAT